MAIERRCSMTLADSRNSRIDASQRAEFTLYHVDAQRAFLARFTGRSAWQVGSHRDARRVISRPRSSSVNSVAVHDDSQAGAFAVYRDLIARWRIVVIWEKMPRRGSNRFVLGGLRLCPSATARCRCAIARDWICSSNPAFARETRARRFGGRVRALPIDIWKLPIRGKNPYMEPSTAISVIGSGSAHGTLAICCASITAVHCPRTIRLGQVRRLMLKSLEETSVVPLSLEKVACGAFLCLTIASTLSCCAQAWVAIMATLSTRCVSALEAPCGPTPFVQRASCAFVGHRFRFRWQNVFLPAAYRMQIRRTSSLPADAHFTANRWPQRSERSAR